MGLSETQIGHFLLKRDPSGMGFGKLEQPVYRGFSRIALTEPGGTKTASRLSVRSIESRALLAIFRP